jgi:hypothetical protein
LAVKILNCGFPISGVSESEHLRKVLATGTALAIDTYRKPIVAAASTRPPFLVDAGSANESVGAKGRHRGAAIVAEILLTTLGTPEGIVGLNGSPANWAMMRP